MAWTPPAEEEKKPTGTSWTPPENEVKKIWTPPAEDDPENPVNEKEPWRLKKLKESGVTLSEKQEKLLWKYEEDRPLLDKAGEAVRTFFPAAAKVANQLGTGSVDLIYKGVLKPIDAMSQTPEEAEKTFKEAGNAWRSFGSGAMSDMEETIDMATRFSMFGSGITDKLQGLPEEERFKRFKNREVMRQFGQAVREEMPDRAAALISENPFLKKAAGAYAKLSGGTPEEVKMAEEAFTELVKESGLTKEELDENISMLGEFMSPVALPGGNRITGAIAKPVGKVVQKTGELALRGIKPIAGAVEGAAELTLKGTELVQGGARKIGEYTTNDPDTLLRTGANTVIMPINAVAKPTSNVARVVKDVTSQVDVGGAAGRRGLFERAGRAETSSDLTRRLFGPQGKGGVARAKVADWTVRQANAIIQPGVNGAALNVLMGLPDIETAAQLGEVAGTGFGIGGFAGARVFDRAGAIIDPTTSLAEKITTVVTPDMAQRRRDEDADIKRFIATATPEMKSQMEDLSNIDKRKTAIDSKLINLRQQKERTINAADEANLQRQIDGFEKQRQALDKATPETVREAERQVQLAFMDAMDLAQATGTSAGLRGLNLTVLNADNAEGFFRNLYGGAVERAEGVVNLLTGRTDLTMQESQNLQQARELLNRFSTEVAGAKNQRGFAIGVDGTDPNADGYVAPHLRKVNQTGATAVINGDLVKHLSEQGFDVRRVINHEMQHALQQFREVKDMLAPIRGDLFDQKVVKDDGTVEVWKQGIFSDADIARYGANYAAKMSPADNGASFIAQFQDVDAFNAYIKDEILAEVASQTGDYSNGTRAALDDVGRNLVDWLEVKTKAGALRKMKEGLRNFGIVFDNYGGYSNVLGADLPPEALAMIRQYQRQLRDFDGSMQIQTTREEDAPDIPMTAILGSRALQEKYKDADFFEKEQILRSTAPDGTVTEIVMPKGAKLDPFVDIYRIQGGQLVDANGNPVQLPPEITFGSLPEGSTFQMDTRIARKPDGSPITLSAREIKSRALERTQSIRNVIDSAPDDGTPNRLIDTGNGNYRGVMSPSQLAAVLSIPNNVLAPALKRQIQFFNELMQRGDGTRAIFEYQAALLNGKYKAIAPKIRDEVPIGWQFTKDGNFALTTISVSRLYDKLQAWADQGTVTQEQTWTGELIPVKRSKNLALWNGDTNKFWNSLVQVLDNHANGREGWVGLHSDELTAKRMRNKVNDLFNVFNKETKEMNPDRSTLPRVRGRDNVDIIVRSRRVDRINSFSESPSTKVPVNYGKLLINYMPETNPLAAPQTPEQFMEGINGSVSATRIRNAIATGAVDQLEAELRNSDDLLPTESLFVSQGEGGDPLIQVTSMLDPNVEGALEPEEVVVDLDARTAAELARLEAEEAAAMATQQQAPVEPVPTPEPAPEPAPAPTTQFMPAEAPSGERGFQSKLQLEIQKKFKGASATPEQLKAVLGNPQNVKPEEVKWSGVMDEIDRLAQENNGKVPVQELLNYLRNEGQVKFEEVTLGGTNAKWKVSDSQNTEYFNSYEEAQEAREEWINNALDYYDLPYAYTAAENWTIEETYRGYVIEDDFGNYSGEFTDREEAEDYLNEWKQKWYLDRSPSQKTRIYDHPFDGGYDSEEDAIDSAKNNAIEDIGSDITIEEDDSSGTNFSSLVLPGGENYREVVLSMPSDLSRSKAKIDAINKRRKEILDTAKEQDLFNRSQTDPEAKALNDLLTAEFVELGKQADQLNADIRDGKTGEQYTSSHFPDVLNYIAHMRVNERTDAEGNPGLFVEEFQSDRHQQGREKGYVGEQEIPEGYKLIDENQSAREAGYEVPSDAPPRWRYEGPGIFSRIYDSKDEAIEAAWKDVSYAGKTRVPDAPFRKDWGVQLFKRALRDAVESGKKWIGWTTGIEQVKRYENAMRQAVDEIEWKTPKGYTKSFDAIKSGRTVLSGKINDDGTVYDSSVSDANGKQLSEVVGKEIAAKILAGDSGTAAGDDLTIGGEGMKGFYDQILPKEIGKYVSKMGGKVEKGSLETEKPRQGAGAELTTGEISNFAGITVGEYLRLDIAEQMRLQQEATDSFEFTEKTPIWRVNITPEMENVVRAGQIQFMPEEQGPLADIQAPEQRGEKKVLAEIEPVYDIPKLPKKYAYGYTTSSDRIKLVSDLAKSKNWNAIRDLNQATIRHAMSDLPGVKYTIKDVLGAFEDEREVSALPEFEINTPEELAAVRKRMVSLAELWNQTEVLEEEVGAGNELLLGTVDNDGYLHTGKYALTFDKLTPSMVEKARKTAGIQSMTIDGNTVIFYDTNNNPAEFERKVDRFGEFVTENGGVLAGSEANIAKIRSYRNPQSPKAGSLYYNEDPVRLFGAGEAPDRLRTKVYRVVSELLGRPLPPPKDGRSSYFVKDDVTPKQVKLQNNIAKKQDAVVLNDKGNKDVVKAYEELNKELLKQYDALIDAGMEFYAAPDYETYEKTYKSSADVIADIRNNNKLVYLQTNPATFGPQKNGKPLDFSFHPLLKNSGRKDKSGNEMNYNDILRVVHDAIAHGIYSAQFGPVGEESAWHTHIRTIDNPWARWALTMETRAQNSWVNYQDKFLNKEKMPKKPGDEGYIPIKQREYAMQKFALIPLKFVLTGEAKVDKPVLELIEQIGPKRAEGSKERRADWMPSKQKEKEILSKVTQPPGDPKKLFADANSFLGKPTKKDGAESTPVIVAKEWFEKKTDQNDGEDGEETGETITVGKAELKDVVLFSQTAMPLVVQPLPNYFAENNATKVSKNVLAIAKNPTIYKAYTDRVVAAGEKIKNDPQRFVTLSGYLEFMRESGASGNLLMPPSQLAEFVKKPQYVLDLWNGGYHGKKTIPGTIAAAKAGLDSVNEMRDLFIVDGKNLGPTPMITALHHLWGILSRQLDPLNQEGMWMRLVSDPAVIEQIQLSIDGKFTLSQEEWQKVVQNARKATKGEYSKIGNNATSNANAFHHMLKKHNGKWNELAAIYTLDDAVKMTNAFWGLNVGATGIKNKVQRFIGLTFGIHGSVLDRWRFVSLNLPMAMKLRGAQTPESYFKYYGKNKTIPEDPVGIYKSYGTVENGNLVFSTALYAGIDKVIEGMIANSPEMRDFLGVHATAGGFHWIDWNCVKNEAVGHSSLDLTKEFLKRKGRKASAEDFLDVVKNTTVYTRADQDGKIFDLVMENGIFRVREE